MKIAQYGTIIVVIHAIAWTARFSTYGNPNSFLFALKFVYWCCDFANSDHCSRFTLDAV